MKATLNRQVTLPSHQDNGNSSKEENQPRDLSAPTKPAMRTHQPPQANEAFRTDSPAANDPTGDEPPLTLIPIDQVMKRTSIGRTTIYQLIRQGEFPQPVKICGASRWVLGEVTDWIESLMSKRRQSL